MEDGIEERKTETRDKQGPPKRAETCPLGKT